jgi:PAS domain S-box-containing protein
VLEAALIVLLLVFTALAARQLREAGPVAHWVAGWAAAGIAGVIPFALPSYPLLGLLAHPLGTLYAALLLSGTYAFAQQPIPKWLLPGALAFGVLRAAVAYELGNPAGYALGLLCEPVAVFSAALLATHAIQSGGEYGRAERLLGPALVVLGAAGAFHLAWLMLGRPIGGVVPIWLAVAPPVLGIQIQAAADRLRRSVRQVLEERVAARTRELAANEERYRTISELASDFAFKIRIDRHANLSRDWIAGAFEATLGMRPEDLDGRGWLRLIEPDAQPAVLAEYMSVRLHRPIALDRRLIGLDGRGRWIHLRLATLRVDADGNVDVLGSARDVTELKTAEQESERLARHVEQVQRLESLGILAGGIAHDFNNLLTVIRGSAQLALGELSEATPARARVARIAEAAQHAASLTDQMLAYAGKSSPERTPLDLGALVASMAELLRASVPERCELVFDGSGALPAIEGDANGMRQVILNLVLNASEAQGDAGGRIIVSTSVASITRDALRDAFGNADVAPGDVVELAVRDDGCGMDAATTARVFEPFFSTKFSGRGLGMAAVLGIVQAHQGAICVASEVGQGTRVRVLFPPSTRRPELRGAVQSVATSPRSGTVLIVDDDDGIRELAAEVLARAGFGVLTAHGGREALECLRSFGAERVGVVLLDLAMPDMSGEEAFLRLRELRGDLPVILVTGYDAARVAERFAARGLDALLRKPWEPEDLIAAVHDHLR